MTVVHSFPLWLPLTQTWMYNEVRFLPDGVEAHIVCEETRNLDQFGLPNIHSLSEATAWRRRSERWARKLGLMRHSAFLVQQARKCRAEVIHSHFGHVGWWNLEAARRAAARHVVSFYGFDASYLPAREPAWKSRYRAMFERADRILCEGPHMGRCLEVLGCPPGKIRIHHLGVRLDEIPFRPRAWTPGHPLKVLIAASFQEKKGIPCAIEVLGRLRRELPLEVTIIGDANDEGRSREEKRKILQAVDRNELRAAIRFPGFRPHGALLEEAYGHHVFLSPSVTARDGDTEGGAPVALIEMAATGMPVVSTTHCDIPEVIPDCRHGLLAAEGDVDGLLAHMRWLAENPGEWGAMVAACRRRLEVEYDAREQGKLLADIYHEL